MQINITDLTTIVSLILALSIASERLVEIVKGMIPFLNKQQDDEKKEGRRRAAIHILAVIAGIVTAMLASPVVPANDGVTKAGSAYILALGLLASGGSSLWNSVLTYLLSVKDIKGLDVEKMKKGSGKETEKALGAGAGAGM